MLTYAYQKLLLGSRPLHIRHVDVEYLSYKEFAYHQAEHAFLLAQGINTEDYLFEIRKVLSVLNPDKPENEDVNCNLKTLFIDRIN